MVLSGFWDAFRAVYSSVWWGMSREFMIGGFRISLLQILLWTGAVGLIVNMVWKIIDNEI